MIVNPNSYRLKVLINWSNIYSTTKYFYHLLFFNHYYLSRIVQDLFLDQKFFFLTQKLHFVYLKNKILTKFNFINTFIFFNDFFIFRKDRKFYRRLFQLFKKNKSILGFQKVLNIINFFYFYFFKFPKILTLKSILNNQFKSIVKLRTFNKFHFIVYKNNFLDIYSIGRIAYNILVFQRRNVWAAINFIGRILTNLLLKKRILGFKYLFVGRFSRRNRASYLWKLLGRLPLNSRLKRIDYISIPVILKYGTCTVHIWIHY